MAERRSSVPNMESRPPHHLSFVQRLRGPITTYFRNKFEAFNIIIDWQWCRQNPLWLLAFTFSTLLTIFCAVSLAWNAAHSAGNNAPAPVESIWLVDSSSTVHITNDLTDFSTYQAWPSTHTPKIRTPTRVNLSTSTFHYGKEVYGSGTVKLEIPHWGHTPRYQLRDVFYIPSYPHKVISLGVVARARKRYHQAVAIVEGCHNKENTDGRPCFGESDWNKILAASGQFVDVEGFTMNGYNYAVSAYVR